MPASSGVLTPAISRSLNALGLLALNIVVLVAFATQLVLGELPCPLCILQRVGFAGVALGLALNVRFGPRPSHYGLAILSAIAGGAVSVRQTLLHIVPGTGSYGSTMLDLHFYSWGVVLYLACIAGCAVLLMFDRQFAEPEAAPAPMGVFGTAMVVLAMVLTLANGVSTVLECGGGLCPDNPTSYQLLENGALGKLFGR